MQNRAFKQALNSAWAMPEGELRRLLEIATRVNLDPQSALAMRTEREERWQASVSGMKTLEGARRVSIDSDGIAFMEISGPLFKKANMFDALSGATSTETVTNDFNLAMNSEDVKGIFIDWDTPGGEVGGTEELANAIYSARGIKPVVSFVSGMACSGGQWGVAGSAKIFANRSSIMGSVGVCTTHTDYSKQDEMVGVQDITILSSNASKKRPDAATDEGKAQIQATLDSIESVFIADLAKSYGVTTRHVIDNFGQGDILIGEKALEVGLVDGLGYRGDALQSLRDMMEPVASEPSIALAKQRQITMDDKTTPNVEATLPLEAKQALDALAASKAPDAKAIKLASYYAATSGVEARLTPAARENLIPLHAALQAFGLEDTLEAFVESMAPMALTQDAITAKGSKVVKETAKGQTFATPGEGVEGDEFDANAYADAYINKANKTRE